MRILDEDGAVQWSVFVLVLQAPQTLTPAGLAEPRLNATNTTRTQ